jgi:hypothetical protein
MAKGKTLIDPLCGMKIAELKNGQFDAAGCPHPALCRNELREAKITPIFAASYGSRYFALVKCDIFTGEFEQWFSINQRILSTNKN